MFKLQISLNEFIAIYFKLKQNPNLLTSEKGIKTLLNIDNLKKYLIQEKYKRELNRRISETPQTIAVTQHSKVLLWQHIKQVANYKDLTPKKSTIFASLSCCLIRMILLVELLPADQDYQKFLIHLLDHFFDYLFLQIQPEEVDLFFATNVLPFLFQFICYGRLQNETKKIIINKIIKLSEMPPSTKIDDEWVIDYTYLRLQPCYFLFYFLKSLRKTSIDNNTFYHYAFFVDTITDYICKIYREKSLNKIFDCYQKLTDVVGPLYKLTEQYLKSSNALEEEYSRFAKAALELRNQNIVGIDDLDHLLLSLEDENRLNLLDDEQEVRNSIQQRVRNFPSIRNYDKQESYYREARERYQTQAKKIYKTFDKETITLSSLFAVLHQIHNYYVVDNAEEKKPKHSTEQSIYEKAFATIDSRLNLKSFKVQNMTVYLQKRKASCWAAAAYKAECRILGKMTLDKDGEGNIGEKIFLNSRSCSPEMRSKLLSMLENDTGLSPLYDSEETKALGFHPLVPNSLRTPSTSYLVPLTPDLLYDHLRTYGPLYVGGKYFKPEEVRQRIKSRSSTGHQVCVIGIVHSWFVVVSDSNDGVYNERIFAFDDFIAALSEAGIWHHEKALQWSNILPQYQKN